MKKQTEYILVFEGKAKPYSSARVEVVKQSFNSDKEAKKRAAGYENYGWDNVKVLKNNKVIKVKKYKVGK